MNKQPYSQNDLISFAEKLPGKKVLVYGDIMLDHYLHGDTSRISPEAPVPVVQVEAHRMLMGGAGNVARNIHSLGGEVSLFSVCGDDNPASILENICGDLKINSRLVRIAGRKTTTKNRIIARHQQVLRFDEEDVFPLMQKDQERIMDELKAELPEHNVLILSDYGKGLINNNFMLALKSHIKNTGLDIKLIVDPKTPNYPFYQDAFLITPNTKETSEATGISIKTREELKEAGEFLLKKLGLSNLLTTLGPEGMALFESNGSIWHIPTTAKEVFDVTGAGDTVIAVVSLCLAASIPLLASCIIANYAAGIVVGEVGASTVSQEELKAVLQEHDSNLVSCWDRL